MRRLSWKNRCRQYERALTDYIDRCPECRGREEYEVLIFDGPDYTGTGRKEHQRCKTCAWAQDVLKDIGGV